MKSTNKTENKSTERYEISSWEDEKLNLKNDLLRGIYAYGFEQPSSIQKKAIYSFIYNGISVSEFNPFTKLNIINLVLLKFKIF